MDAAFWQWNDIWLSPAFRDFDIGSGCSSVEPPLPAVQGEDDPYGTLRQIDDARALGESRARAMRAFTRDQSEPTTRAVATWPSCSGQGCSAASKALPADGWHTSSHAVAIGLSVLPSAAARHYASDARFGPGTGKNACAVPRSATTVGQT